MTCARGSSVRIKYRGRRVAAVFLNVSSLNLAAHFEPPFFYIWHFMSIKALLLRDNQPHPPHRAPARHAADFSVSSNLAIFLKSAAMALTRPSRFPTGAQTDRCVAPTGWIRCQNLMPSRCCPPRRRHRRRPLRRPHRRHRRRAWQRLQPGTRQRSMNSSRN